jgi:hypothetical protein
MMYLAIHCGPITGGFGCDMGELPAPPAALAWVLYAVAIVGIVIGVVGLMTGWLPKIGRLRTISTPAAGRTMALVELLLSVSALIAAFGVGFLSRHVEPPHWLAAAELVIVPAATLLEWQARRMDRRSRPSPSV